MGEWPNLAAMMFGLARQWPRRPMLRHYQDGAWHGVTWAEFARRASVAVTVGFTALCVAPFGMEEGSTANVEGGELGVVEVANDGTVTVRAGTSSHGQGHATSFSMIVADRFGIAMEQIRFEQSDTALVPRGSGTGGSRSLQLGGSAVAGAADDVLGRAKLLAAALLEASPADIELTDGRFSGGTTGLCVGHVAPEACDGGPIALVQDGDRIRLDLAAGRLDLLVEPAELERRRAGWKPLEPRYTTGVLGKYAKLVGSAAQGAVTG